MRNGLGGRHLSSRSSSRRYWAVQRHSELVKQGTVAAQGASVTFTMTGPNGTSTKNVSTDSTGKASWSYKVLNKAPKGTYSVSITATLGSQSTTAGPMTLLVK